MADASIDLQATNVFNVGANFNTTSSGTNVVETNVQIMDEVGNVECQRNLTDITNYTQSLTYCGSDFIADFVDTSGTPVPFLENFGCTFNSKIVTGITISMTAGEYATVEITGHQHDTNAHDGGATPTGATRAQALALGIADVSDFLPHEVAEAFNGWDGFGVPDFGMTLGSDSALSSATATFSMNHIDQIDNTGSHVVGKNITPRCELSGEFIGVPTSNTTALLEADFAANTNSMLTPLADSTDTNDSNSDFDTFAFAAHANTDLATV